MSAETAYYRHIVYKKIVGGEETSKVKKTSLFDYPECNGRPSSSSDNWVPADFLGYRLAKLLHVTDEDLKKKTKKSSIIMPR